MSSTYQPLETTISTDPNASGRAQRSGYANIPRHSGPEFSTLDMAGAILAVLILLGPLAMAAIGAHTGG